MQYCNISDKSTSDGTYNFKGAINSSFVQKLILYDDDEPTLVVLKDLFKNPEMSTEDVIEQMLGFESPEGRVTIITKEQFYNLEA